MDSLKETVVVYAEDEVEVRAQVARFLRRRVKELHEAENGAEGLELIKDYNPDIIITDIEMPVMNGLEMIEKIREIYDGKKRIIVITGYMDDEHYTDMADVYLYKPLNLQHLIDAIEGLLPTLRK